MLNHVVCETLYFCIIYGVIGNSLNSIDKTMYLYVLADGIGDRLISVPEKGIQIVGKMPSSAYSNRFSKEIYKFIIVITEEQTSNFIAEFDIPLRTLVIDFRKQTPKFRTICLVLLSTGNDFHYNNNNNNDYHDGSIK